ncbi:MAG: hypothetical protein U0T81_18320 [Saprospiraceae bacterium]
MDAGVEQWFVPDTTSPPPPAAPVLIPLNTVLLESPAGSGNYILNGIHVDSLGFSVTVTNGTLR